jgi:hypothetical protein
MERASFTAATPHDPNGIIAEGADYTAEPVTLLTGTAYTAGMVLGKVTASGKFAVSTAGASNGTETPTAILLETVDATGGDAVGVVLKAGAVNTNKINLSGSFTVAGVKDDLIARGIFLK